VKTIRLLSGGAAQGLVEALRPSFEAQSGWRIDGVFAIAVREGDSLPAVADAAELRMVLGKADEIHFPDPEQATAGIHFAKVMKALGLWQDAARRLRPASNGAVAMRALAASTSHRPIGCTQATEILSTTGVALVAPLPPGCDLTTTYTAAVSTRSEWQAEAVNLIRLLTTNGVGRFGFD
jgi:molybdate transport system substrate-binding protein